MNFVGTIIHSTAPNVSFVYYKKTDLPGRKKELIFIKIDGKCCWLKNYFYI
jgi:hypothetical protein